MGTTRFRRRIYLIILSYELVSKRRISQQEIDLYNVNSFGLSIVDPTHSLIHVIRIGSVWV